MYHNLTTQHNTTLIREFLICFYKKISQFATNMSTQFFQMRLKKILFIDFKLSF